MSGKYKTVVIDPPWPVDYAKWSLMDPKKGFQAKQKMRRYQTDYHSHYSTMSLEDIAKFPIDDYAAKEALLFLWVTNSMAEKTPVIRYGFDLLDKWGFKYHIIITWDKCNSYALFSPIRRQTEHVLVGYRGNFAKLINKQYGVMSNLISTHYQNYHSQKPVQFYQMLRGWTPKPRIDIFARQAHEGFDGWGNEYVGEGPLQEFLK